eukprot:353814-Chlamydomonas_euryale.AAC.2
MPGRSGGKGEGRSHSFPYPLASCMKRCRGHAVGRICPRTYFEVLLPCVLTTTGGFRAFRQGLCKDVERPCRGADSGPPHFCPAAPLLLTH